jgi:hypothetical protein
LKAGDNVCPNSTIHASGGGLTTLVLRRPRRGTAAVPGGVYRIIINSREVPADAPADVRRALIAEYVLTFSVNGRFKTVANGELDAAGRYASTADHLVITDETGAGHCKITATGIYKWRLEGNKLTLEAVDDGCKWRRFSVTLKKWTKEK